MGLLSRPQNYPGKLSPQLQDVVDKVLQITHRPELYDLTIQRILSSTLAMHRKENFVKDIRTKELMFSVPSSDRNIPAASIADCRTMLVIRADRNTKPLRKNTIDQALATSTIIGGTNCWSFLGMNYNIKTSQPHGLLTFIYLAKPNLTAEGYSSWVASDHTDLLLADVCTFIFGHIGDSTAAALSDKRMREILLPQLFSEEVWSEDAFIHAS